jgi:hypothetical protein
MQGLPQDRLATRLLHTTDTRTQTFNNSTPSQHATKFLPQAAFLPVKDLIQQACSGAGVLLKTQAILEAIA